MFYGMLDIYIGALLSTNKRLNISTNTCLQQVRTSIPQSESKNEAKCLTFYKQGIFCPMLIMSTGSIAMNTPFHPIEKNALSMQKSSMSSPHNIKIGSTTLKTYLFPR